MSVYPHAPPSCTLFPSWLILFLVAKQYFQQVHVHPCIELFVLFFVRFPFSPFTMSQHNMLHAYIIDSVLLYILAICVLHN